MEFCNLSKFGIIFGAVIMTSSIIRWFFLMPDYSNLIFGVGIGGFIVLFSYLYSWMREVNDKFIKVNERVDALLNWQTKMEWK